MKFKKLSFAISSALLATGLLASQAYAKGRLVVYCSATNEMCEAEIKAFGEKYDVKTSFIRNGSGSTFAKIEAEKNNPQADVWYGGTFDPQSQAGELGLLQPYRSPNVDQIVPRFQDPAKVKGNYTSAIYMGILGFGVNTERLKKLGINEVPKCWKDLTDPRLKGEIQIANPQSSGTAYTAIATFVQLWGEKPHLITSKTYIQTFLNTQNLVSHRPITRHVAKRPLVLVSYMTTPYKNNKVRQLK